MAIDNRKNISAHYVLHYIGNSVYIIGKKGGVVDTVCVRVNIEGEQVDILYNDRFSMIPIIDLAIAHGREVPRHYSYASYRSAVADGGPVAIDIYGVGLVTDTRLTFHRIDHVVDGRAYDTLNDFEVAAPRWDFHAALDWFRFEERHFRRRSVSAWQPNLALGAQCVQLEYRAIVESISDSSANAPYSKWWFGP
jgi:hypothetical protein